MLLDVSLLINGNRFNFTSSPHEHCAYVTCGDKWFKLPVDITSLSFGKQYFYITGEEIIETEKAPFNVRVYSYEGNYVCNISNIIDDDNKRVKQYFYGIMAHTKGTLLQPPWPGVFNGSILNRLDESHEYLTAYDGGQQWLFDITDKRYILRVFTH